MAALSAVAIVSTDRYGKSDRNDWDTQHVGTLKPQFLHYVTIKLCLLFFNTKILFLVFAPLLFGSHIYQQQATTFSAQA
jgi:hypothetical protein